LVKKQQTKGGKKKQTPPGFRKASTTAVKVGEKRKGVLPKKVLEGE